MCFKSWYEQWIYNPKAKVIAKSMKNNPENWSHKHFSYADGKPFTVKNKKGLEVWVVNGWWFCSIHSPYEETLGLIGRTVVWFAYKSLQLPKKNPTWSTENSGCL